MNFSQWAGKHPFRSPSRIPVCFPSRPSVSFVLISGLKPRVMHVQASRIETIEQCRPLSRFRQLPAEEKRAGLQLALIEIAVGFVGGACFRYGNQGLPQPDPTDDRMADQVEIDRRIRQTEIDFAAAGYAQEVAG